MVPVRRAPFSDNPEIGTRGRQTRQNILDAALRVSAEHGYHECSVERIAKAAGCSRISFYQYFSSKGDLFRELVDEVAREVSTSIEALGPLRPDRAGWDEVRAWVADYRGIYERYEPVFAAYASAAEYDDAIAAVRVVTGDRNVASIQSRIVSTSLPRRELGPVIALLLESTKRTFLIASMLRASQPDAYSTELVDDAVADVIHRSLFGVRVSTESRRAARDRPLPLRFSEGMWETADAATNNASNITRKTLKAAGRHVFVTRGYYGTRIDDIVATAGLSHGAFYRYYRNKAHFAHELALEAMEPVSIALDAIPAVAPGGAIDRAALERWLRRYNQMLANEAAMIGAWIDATNHDSAVGTDALPAIDWGRRRMVHSLSPRGEFGDIDIDAIVAMALLDAFGRQPRSARAVRAVADIIERGLLGAS